MSDVDFYLNRSLVVNNNVAINGSIFHGNTQHDVGGITITSNTIIDTAQISVIRSVSYLIQVSSESGYQISEIMLVHDNIKSHLSEFGQLSSCGYALANFTTEVVNNQVRLLGTATDANAKVWFHTTQMNTVVPMNDIVSRDESPIVARDGSVIIRRV